MINALYTAASGMVAQSIRQDVVANNIANAQTPGFKRERVVTSSFQEALDKTAAAMEAADQPTQTTHGVQGAFVCAEAANDASDGPLRSTDNPLNFAIQGTGTFTVGTRQTRNGSFVVDQDGELASSDGEKVQGKTGPIRMPSGNWTVTEDGAIVNAKGAVVDQIQINNAEPGKTRVMQGYLEDSNVSVVREMVDMIANMRSYEANQKVVASVDGTLDKLINEVGRV